jgi:ribosome-binding factor A
MPSRSNLRLTEVIRQRAAHVILFELRDPRMGFVTITKVKLAPDMSTCVIYWSVIGTDGDKSKTLHALEHARLFIQRRVAEGLRTRSAPVLSFEFDPSVEGAIKMGGLLKTLRDERGDAPPLPAAADGGEAAGGGEAAEGEDAEETDEEEDDDVDEDASEEGEDDDEDKDESEEGGDEGESKDEDEGQDEDDRDEKDRSES